MNSSGIQKIENFRNRKWRDGDKLQEREGGQKKEKERESKRKGERETE